MSSLILFEPSFYLLAAIVVLLTGMSKGGFAGGLGTLAVPLLTLAIDPRVAAAIMLPILVCMDFVSLATYRKYCDRAILMTLVPAAIVGIIIGTLTFQLMSAQFIRLIIGLLSLYIGGQFFVKRWRKTDLSKGSLPSPAPSPKKGRLWGCVSGFTSFVAHAGGPPLSTQKKATAPHARTKKRSTVRQTFRVGGEICSRARYDRTYKIQNNFQSTQIEPLSIVTLF